MATLQPGLNIIGLKDGDTLLSDQINVRVKGNAGTTLKLFVNGDEIGNNRVSVRSEDAARGVQVREYIGLKLRAGNNVLRLTQTDSFGVNRGDVSINVIAPGSLGRVKLTVPNQGIGADGQTATRIGVELVDDKGIRVTARTPLTLEASAGRFNVRDLNETQPGTQVFLEGGQGSFELIAPFEPGQAVVGVSAGIIAAEAQLSFVPYLRPVVAAGIFEGQFGFKANSAIELPIAAFERELQSITGNGGGACGGLRQRPHPGQISALDALRFAVRRRQPPVPRHPARRVLPGLRRQLDQRFRRAIDRQTLCARGQRTLLRVVWRFHDLLVGRLGIVGPLRTRFDGRAVARRRREVFGDGVSFRAPTLRASCRSAAPTARGGVYQLGLRDIRPQSEIVEIVVRDRNNPGRVISATQQTRFTDYTLDGFTFGLLFRRPIPSFDEDGNPVFIRVTYEREIGGPDFTVAGASAQVKVGNRLQVGAGIVQDDDPVRRMNLRAVNGTLKLSSDTVLVAEYAQTDTPEFGTAGASRFELRKEGANFQARAFVGNASSGFNNPEAVLSRGRSESGVQLTTRLGARTQLQAEAIRTKDNQTGAKTQGIQAGVEHAFNPNIRGSLGIRNASGDAGGFAGGANDNLSFTSIYGRLNARITPRANAFTRYEQELAAAATVPSPLAPITNSHRKRGSTRSMNSSIRRFRFTRWAIRSVATARVWASRRLICAAAPCLANIVWRAASMGAPRKRRLACATPGSWGAASGFRLRSRTRAI